MTGYVDQLLQHPDVVHGDPASRSTIDALAMKYGAKFPEPLLKIWSAGDLTLETLDAHILGADEVLRLVEKEHWPRALTARGFVPLLNDHQANYLAVLVREPLAFRVAHVPHDDGSRLVYRELEGCARALLEALAAGESADMFFHDTDGDYTADAPRTPTDQQAARLLLATDGEHGEWNYATQLLDESNLEGWARLLETDHFVRRDVVARMRKLHSPFIRELLARDQHAFDEFARRVADAARNDGLKVGEQRNGVLRVNGSWMNLDGFFYRRSIPEAMPRMMAWFQDLVAKRDPRERPNNFMKD
jgi:hypothetical protein